MIIFNKVKQVLLSPPYVKHCSQTVYEALLGCLKMYEVTANRLWLERSEVVKGILLDIQRPDGGFDIGYDFNFGKLHKKGESTSPELVGLLALCEYTRIVGKDDKVIMAMDKAANWIKLFSMKLDDNRYIIPYGPYSTKEVMVYNGTSFACAALGCYIGIKDSTDTELIDIYEGMNLYLLSVMSSVKDKRGKFWYYSDQERQDMDEIRKGKIDYYHQMQQVEVHSIAQRYYKNKNQRILIEFASDHVLDMQNSSGVVPYTNNKVFFNDLIYVWGFSSLISGFLEANKIIPKQDYIDASIKVKNWLLEYAWNGDFFYSVLFPDGRCKNSTYMVRSDAWVFNALSTFYQYQSDKELYDVIEHIFEKMYNCNFSGKESHAQNFKKKLISKILKKIK